MDVLTAINTRRSVRSFTGKAVSVEAVKTIINAAAQAPSACNSQPWSFIVIQDGGYLRDLSKRIKSFCLENLDTYPVFKNYVEWLKDEAYDVFYHAGTLVIICADKNKGIYPVEDCNLAAENLMLAAHAQGLGTCWIGFAREFLNRASVKQELGMGENLQAVAPIIAGFPQGESPQVAKNPPVIRWISPAE